MVPFARKFLSRSLRMTDKSKCQLSYYVYIFLWRHLYRSSPDPTLTWESVTHRITYYGHNRVNSPCVCLSNLKFTSKVHNRSSVERKSNPVYLLVVVAHRSHKRRGGETEPPNSEERESTERNLYAEPILFVRSLTHRFSSPNLGSSGP